MIRGPIGPADRALKAVCKALIRSVGGTEAAAEIGGRGQGRMSDYGSVNSPLFMPVDVIDKLEAAAPEPLVTKFLATRRGAAMFPLPEPGPVDRDWRKHLLHLAQDPSEIMTDILKGLSNDGELTPREVRDSDLVAETRRAIGSLVELLAALEAVVAGED